MQTNVFSLEDQTCTLTNFNPRPELHGEDPKPAADLSIEVSLPNDDLALFHPTLKSLIYHYDKSGDPDLVDQAREGEKDYAPHLRFPKLGALHYKEEIVGAKVTIDYGLKSDIELNGCNINKFVLDPQVGGTVIVTFRIQMHPDEKQAGKLYTLMGNEITLTIEPPEADAELDVDEEEETA